MHTNFTFLYLFRCESYNSLIRGWNIFGNKQSPSRDIARRFAIQESIRFHFSGSFYKPSDRYITINIIHSVLQKYLFHKRCGEDLMQLYRSTEVQQYLYGDVSHSDKPIYKQGTLRKVKI